MLEMADQAFVRIFADDEIGQPIFTAAAAFHWCLKCQGNGMSKKIVIIQCIDDNIELLFSHFDL